MAKNEHYRTLKHLPHVQEEAIVSFYWIELGSPPPPFYKACTYSCSLPEKHVILYRCWMLVEQDLTFSGNWAIKASDNFSIQRTAYDYLWLFKYIRGLLRLSGLNPLKRNIIWQVVYESNNCASWWSPAKRLTQVVVVVLMYLFFFCIWYKVNLPVCEYFFLWFLFFFHYWACRAHPCFLTGDSYRNNKKDKKNTLLVLKSSLTLIWKGVY